MDRVVIERRVVEVVDDGGRLIVAIGVVRIIDVDDFFLVQFFAERIGDRLGGLAGLGEEVFELTVWSALLGAAEAGAKPGGGGRLLGRRRVVAGGGTGVPVRGAGGLFSTPEEAEAGTRRWWWHGSGAGETSALAREVGACRGGGAS